ncbi:MAG: fibronectin type III domain-containing protein [Candidatus Doudnabacteria bacterium]|nr:fibronectin type III domain-containing protein [Candidatus Doudnabacteria bacterium]
MQIQISSVVRKVMTGAALVTALAGVLLPRLSWAEPSITSVSATQITTTGATITWQTNVPADTYVSYLAEGNLEDPELVGSDTLVTNHAYALTGLTPNTVYFYFVNSMDAAEENTSSDGGYFTTLSGNPAPTPTPTPIPVITVSPTPYPSTTPTPTGLTIPLQYEEPLAQSPMYPTGTLATENGVVYFLMGRDQVKIPFSSMEVFGSLGYSLSSVQQLDLSQFRMSRTYFLDTQFEQHPWGSLLRDVNGTVYYSHWSGMIGVPTMGVLVQNGLDKLPLLPMNVEDRAILQSSEPVPVLELNDIRLM